ncbi:MAG: histidine phosphatase family protein [Pirellulales bacterium]
MILYCVRHGESSYNIEGRLQGQSDVPLSPLGVRQSQAVAAALADRGIEAVYSSPLARAYQTALPLAETLKLPVITDERLMEINVGVFQGLLRSELSERHPEEAARWASHDPDFCIPRGESRRDLMRRAEEAFDAIREAGHARAAVVAHGGLLAAAFKVLLQIPAELNPFSLYNASISVLSWSSDVKLLTLNQTSHLQQAQCERTANPGEL